MIRRLPCEKCPDGATLKNVQGKKIPYEMQIPPSAFRTPGQAFRYDCMGCGKKQSITKGAFYALPDLGLPPVQPVFEPAAIVARAPVLKASVKPSKKAAKKPPAKKAARKKK